MHASVALRRNQTGVCDAVNRRQTGVTACINGAAVGNAAAGIDLRIAGGLNASGVGQPAIGLQHNVACGGTYDAAVAHAHAGFAPDQCDLAGVHAAQGRCVQREGGCGTSACDRRHAGLRGVYPVGACDHFEFVGQYLAIDFDGPCQNAGVVGLTRIEAGSVNGDQATLHHKAVEVAARHGRGAGRDRGAAGVDKPASVNVHASRVGDDDFGSATGHFDKPAQLAGVARIDFVENHTGAAGS